MPTGPAARVGDTVAHPAPPVLGPGPGSTKVLIGNKPAWRGVGGAAAAAIKSAKEASDKAIQAAEKAARRPGCQGRRRGRQGGRCYSNGLHDRRRRWRC
jgi:hypothetical protein